MPDHQYIVYGASDDLIEIDGPGGDEFNSEGGIATFGGALRLEIDYGDTGTWTIRVVQMNEDVLIPCEVLIDQHPEVDYSARARFTLPDHLPATVVFQERSDD